jgi:hypothetical protein
MADTQPQDTGQSSPAIADLAGSDDKSMSGLVSSLTELQRKKVGSDTKLEGEFNVESAQDRARREQAFKAEGVAASEMPKAWDADKEHKKWETNPIEGFGSAGGLFAMVASAFTKAPMENAINGMAGAINSIKEGNEAGYTRAYDAFKENVKLADQRFKTQHELYNDALSLGTADMAASQAKFRNAATKFGDSQMLMLAEHGMIKEIYELQSARATANEQMMKAADAIDLHTVQKAAVNAIKANPPATGDPVQDKMMLAAQIQRVYDANGKYGTAEQEAVGRYMQANMQKSPQEIADGLAEIHQKFSVKAPNIQGYQEARQAYMDAHDGAIPPDEDAKLLQQFGLTYRPPGATGSGGGASLTNERVINRDAEAHKQQMAKEHPDWDEAKLEADRDKYVKERKIATTAPTATNLDTIRGKQDRITNMDHTIDEVEALLKKHNALTGLGGKITRPAEVVGNIFGSNETDRKQFERYVAELQEWAPAALNDRNGRPLSSEASKIQTIIAGLNLGDTTANTARAYAELRPLLKTIKQQLEARGAGGSSPPPAKSEDTGKDAPWLRDPVKP